ncbi:PREDICTED: uncharacterized protein LOC105359446 [Ceratosolen solmsi marchali]|uniref:Uncharacterized protein LOC105359446 n=1 Tax=Ceratosolen solmsi marchali TaxID=326594 RepID=A0AAJ6VJH1_9HYME|nr:PREDICTED: uncharacterized protein LOC105359446 [Ceratosolen solmsi marchali]
MAHNGKSDCPPVDPRPPYDEVNHQVGSINLSIKVPKNVGRLINVDAPNAKDDTACAKVNVIQNKMPPAKSPEQEILLLHATRYIMNVEEMQNTLELELKMPRNYEPYPEPPPFKILFQDNENEKEDSVKDEPEESPKNQNDSEFKSKSNCCANKKNK